MMNSQQKHYKKHSIQRLMLALIACLMIVSCGSLTPPVIVQPVQQQVVLPAILAVPCERPVKRRDNTADGLAEALKLLYDQYGQCSGRFIEVLNYINEVNNGQR